MVKQTTSNVFSANTKSNSTPATAKKTSLLILLEAAGVLIQKIQNPLHVHGWKEHNDSAACHWCCTSSPNLRKPQLQAHSSRLGVLG